MAEFQGKTVLVTGGGSGIGRCCALAFAEAGARVLVADRDEAAAGDTLCLMSGSAEQGACLAFDVTVEAEVHAAIARASVLAPIDILVNCAGIGATQSFLETDVALLDRMFAVNLRGTFLCAQAVARGMVAVGRGGVIVNVGSASGARGNAGRAAYGATKAAVANLTQVMAVELARLGVRVNAVAPGPIETPLVAAAHSEAVRDGWLRELPDARYGAASEVAAAVLFLASPRSTYITGHILAVDGGFAGAGVMSA
ncbi:SDR family NAD(P)-dependent oxidoreductase [Roseomonas sp. WA12]